MFHPWSGPVRAPKGPSAMRLARRSPAVECRAARCDCAAMPKPPGSTPPCLLEDGDGLTKENGEVQGDDVMGN